MLSNGNASVPGPAAVRQGQGEDTVHSEGYRRLSAVLQYSSQHGNA